MLGEELLAGKDVGGSDFAAGVGDFEVCFLDRGEAEELGGVDEGEEVFAASDCDEDLEEAGQPADGCVRERLLAGRDGIADNAAAVATASTQTSRSALIDADDYSGARGRAHR